MMNKQYTLIVLLATISMYLGCKEDRKEVDTEKVEDSIWVDKSEWVLDNAFTRIKNSMCDTIPFESAAYTNKNTQIFSLNEVDSTEYFLFISEIDCGHPAGSCGQSIELIHRKGEEYISLGEYCGKLDSVAINKKYLYYSTMGGRSYKLTLNKSRVQATLLSIHGMFIKDLSTISELSGIYQDNLILAGQPTENLDAVPVRFKKITLHDATVLHIYNLDNFGTPVAFAFMYQREKRKQQFSGAQIECIENTDAIIIHKEDGSYTWKYNEQQKIFLKQK